MVSQPETMRIVLRRLYQTLLRKLTQVSESQLLRRETKRSVMRSTKREHCILLYSIVTGIGLSEELCLRIRAAQRMEIRTVTSLY
ncbi:hypothetical protein GGR93_003308 [Sulfitobacter noctilucicola]|uniref:Uncharacterized protein n=1 Tax=Sulfitobacter noctilucicola TaxID=1342301 RepID=A0A7W6MAJ5_9RHOB|nr:hypothetical protein [Sulfitobacter noctilucicola]